MEPRPAGGSQLMQAHVSEFRFPEPQVAETECEMLANGVELGEEPGGVAVGGKDLDDRLEIDGSCTSDIPEGDYPVVPRHAPYQTAFASLFYYGHEAWSISRGLNCGRCACCRTAEVH